MSQTPLQLALWHFRAALEVARSEEERVHAAFLAIVAIHVAREYAQRLDEDRAA